MQSPVLGLAIVSDHVEGIRLSEILRVASDRRLQLDINAALCLIRQLVPSVALMHENARDVAHGLLAPERLIVTPRARLVIAEHVLGAAVEQLQFSRERLWQEFRIALPSSAGMPRFDHRADITAVGLVALALVLGRPLRTDEYPHQIATLLNGARERTALGDEQPLSPPLRDWLARALQLDPRRAFASAPEALSVLEEVVADETTYIAAPVALETFLSRYIAALLEPSGPDASGSAAVPMEPRIAPPPAPVVQAPAVPPLSIGSGAMPPPVAAATHASAPAPPVWTSLQNVRPAPAAAPPASALPPAPAGGPASVERTTTFFDVKSVDPPPALPDIAELLAATDTRPLRAVTADRSSEAAAAALSSADTMATPQFFEPEPDRSVHPENKPALARRGRTPWKVPVAAAAAVLVLGAAGYAAVRARGASADLQTGTLDIQSMPAGAQVFVDGEQRGATPAKLTVKPGAHILELRGRGVPRVIPISVAAGGQVSQYLEFPDAPSTGQLMAQSQPAGARVTVDGIDRGIAPVTVSDLTPGDHEVVMKSDSGSVRQTVTVQAGGTASLVAPVGGENSAGPVSGWVTVKAPVSVQIREGGRLVGSSDADRLMMTAGRHELQIENELLGYQVTRVVQVPPGKVASITLDLPNGVVNLNASPWAEVWIDGRRVGETPIGNLNVPIGPHEVVFQNPQLGEKRHAIAVSLSAPIRLSVDMK